MGEPRAAAPCCRACVNMKPEDKALLIEIYSRSLAHFGDTAEAVKWTELSQRYRFKILTEIADLETTKLLDYGCGKGDLFQYLLEGGFRGSYTGFDINPELIDLARNKFPAARFELRDIELDTVDEHFDYVLISGVFNNRISDNGGMMRSLLPRCFSLAERGMSFNAISTYVNFREPEMFYTNPEETFSFCMTQLSSLVTLRHDNIPRNFTVYVYRKPEWRR